MTKNVAIVGATGAVGTEMLRCLETRAFPVGELHLLASAASAGKKVRFNGQDVTLKALEDFDFAGVDIALLAVDTDIALECAARAMQAGATVIDNSSAFRMREDVPLVVPEVNGALLSQNPRLIANPNCVTAIMVMALAPLHRVARVERVHAASYQAASGAGLPAMRELEESTRAYLAGQTFEPKVLPHPYAFNFFSHNTPIDPDTGYNGEETKVMRETRKIMDLPDLRISITCVRVPVLRAHGIAMSVEFDQVVTPETAREVLAHAPGVRLVDDVAANRFPMPVEASGIEDVLVGRIRRDASDPTGKTLSLFVCGDQLLKGAALNAVQIAEQLT